MTEKKKIRYYNTRLSKEHILAIEKRMGITPPTSKIFPQGLAKVRILKQIEDNISQNLASIDNSISQE